MQITTPSNRLLSLHFIAVRFLPLGFPALHLLFGDGERLADGVVETFGFGGWKLSVAYNCLLLAHNSQWKSKKKGEAKAKFQNTPTPSPPKIEGTESIHPTESVYKLSSIKHLS